MIFQHQERSGLRSPLCCLCMNMGVMFAWPSSTLQLFKSNSTTLHRPMTGTEESLLGSLPCISALISTPVTGLLLDRLGRKNLAIVTGIIEVLSWTLVATSNRVEAVLSAVFVSGLSGSVFLVVPLYISEFCQESIRGAMTSGAMLFYGVGMLFSYLMGGYMEYYTMIYTCLSASVAGTAMLCFLKETPVCLMIKGLEDEAAKSLAFYRGAKHDSKEVQEELLAIRRTLQQELDSPEVSPETEKLNPSNKSQEKLSVIQFFKKSRSTRKAFFVTMVVVTASVFQGLVVVQVYAGPLFEKAVPSLSTTMCSVVFAAVTVVASTMGAFLTELAGRRPLMIYGSLLSFVACIALGTQIQLHWGPSWLTVVIICLFAVTFTLGAGTVPFVMIAEVFLPEVKSFMSMLAIEWAWFCSSIILFVFTPLLNAIGLGPVFYIFAAVCLLTAVFCHFQQPETKGLTVDVIQTKFDKKSHRLY